MSNKTSTRTAALTAALVIAITMAGCHGGSNQSHEFFNDTIYAPSYAQGFAIIGNDTMSSTVIRVSNPWQGADGVVMDCFVRRDGENPPPGFKGTVVDAGAGRIVCMSSSHVAMLDAIDETRRIAGVSGVNYISNPQVMARRDSIADVGAELNHETVAVLHPDVVLLYGVTNAQTAMTDKLDELRIPYIYIGEYLEPSPLGKAEWMVAIAELLDMRDRGIDAFGVIPSRYDSLRSLVADVTARPKVMVNAPWSDTWYMPSTSSCTVRLIEDAGGEYVFKGNDSNASSTIGMETALTLLSQSDVWLDAGHVADLDELKAANPAYADMPPVRNKRVYNCDLRTNAYGANDYWESAVVRPDVVLRDLIGIMHPEVCDDVKPYYYRQLK